MGRTDRVWLRGAAIVAALLVVATAAAAAVNEAAVRGWQPLVQLMGKGETQRAVSQLRKMTQVWDAALHRLDMDPATEAWVEQTWESFEDFDMDGFYENLPEARSRNWRRLAVYGEAKGSRYRVRRASANKPFEVQSGKRDRLGDMSAVLQAKPVKGQGRKQNYLLHARFGLGLGDLDWQSVVDASTELMRLSSDAQAPTPSVSAVAAVKKAHPKLGPRDVRLLAVFWDAFPALGETLTRIGRLDALVASGTTEPGLVHFRGRGQLKLEAMEDHYDEFADFLDDMGELMAARSKLLDKKGRTLFKSTLKSGDMSMDFEFYVKDGKLIPFKRGKAYVDAPVDLMGKDLERMRAVVDMDMKVMGLTISLKNLYARFRYEPSGARVAASGSLTQVPQIKVSGAAMGMFPPGLIDLFIPGNMEQICRDFLTTAVHGNNSHGIALAMRLGKAPDGGGTVETTLGFEALNNFFVKFGMGIAADRVLPDDDEQQDMERFAADVHRAFVRDLDRFARR